MYPHERSLVQRLRGMPFALLGINSDKDLEQLRTTMAKEQITWRSWWDGGGTRGPISTLYRVPHWPNIYVLDHRGVIRYKETRGDDMDKVVDALLEELAQDPDAESWQPARAPSRKKKR
jgi:hypothetical protein